MVETDKYFEYYNNGLLIFLYEKQINIFKYLSNIEDILCNEYKIFDVNINLILKKLVPKYLNINPEKIYKLILNIPDDEIMKLLK